MSLFLFKMTLFLPHIWQAAQKGLFEPAFGNKSALSVVVPCRFDSSSFHDETISFFIFLLGKNCFCSHIYYPLLSASWNKRFFLSPSARRTQLSRRIFFLFEYIP